MGVNPASYRKDHAATHPVSTNPICPPDCSTSQHINLQGRPDTRVSLLFFSPQPVCISKSHVANIAPFFFCFVIFLLLLVWPDPTCPFGNISNWMLPYPGRATHIHHGCCRPDSWWFRTLGVLAARQRCQLLHSLTTAAASHGCFPAVTPASRQEEALSLSLSLPVQKSKIAALINVSF